MVPHPGVSARRSAHLKILFSAPDDIEESAKIQSILEDIWVARFAKTRKGLEGMEIHTLFALRVYLLPILLFLKARSHSLSLAKWNNLTGLEVNHLRQFLGPAIDHFHKLLGEVDEPDASASSGSMFSQRQTDSVGSDSVDPPPRKLRRR